MTPTRLSHFVSKSVLVKVVGDAAAEPHLFTLVAIEPFGLWLEAMTPPADAAQQASAPSDLPSGAVLVPFAQIAYLTDGAALHTAWRFASHKAGERTRAETKSRAVRPRSKKTDMPKVSLTRSTRRGG